MGMMKKLAALLLSTVLPVATLSACGTAPAYSNRNWNGKSLKVLAIGNSYSVDAMTWVYDIAKAHGVEEVVLGNLYVGSCSLQMHHLNAETDSPEYIYYKNNMGRWASQPGFTLLQGLQDEEWDVIVLQQASAPSGLAESYEPYLSELVQYVQENKTNPKAKLGWHMTWAYPDGSTREGFEQYGSSNETMYAGILSCVREQVLGHKDFSIVIPTGTALQNARAVFGNQFSVDAWHHLNDFGKLIAGYMWFCSLTGTEPESLAYMPASLHFFEETERAQILSSVTQALNDPFLEKK